MFLGWGKRRWRTWLGLYLDKKKTVFRQNPLWVRPECWRINYYHAVILSHVLFIRLCLVAVCQPELKTWFIDWLINGIRGWAFVLGDRCLTFSRQQVFEAYQVQRPYRQDDMDSKQPATAHSSIQRHWWHLCPYTAYASHSCPSVASSQRRQWRLHHVRRGKASYFESGARPKGRKRGWGLEDKAASPSPPARGCGGAL